MKLVPILPEHAGKWWETAKPLMASFIERAAGRYEEQDILDMLTKGDAMLWLAMDGHIIKAGCMTHIIKYPRLMDLRIFMMVGEHQADWLHLIRGLEDYARSIGCKKITGDARPGWERLLKPYDYQKTHVYLEKDL